MNEQDIPIDIHVNKLSDWLVSRRIVDKNWQRNVKDVRNKINEALKDMPGNEELIELLSGSCEYLDEFKLGYEGKIWTWGRLVMSSSWLKALAYLVRSSTYLMVVSEPKLMLWTTRLIFNCIFF